MNQRALVAVVTAVVLSAAAVGIGLAVAAGGGTSSSAMMGTDSSGRSMHSYYQSMMKNYDGNSMMGGTSTGKFSYDWMMGGTTAPGWMRGGSLPASMMDTSSDGGAVMGRLFANAPGARLSAVEATRLGNQVAAGATVDRADNRITFPGPADHLVVLANPSARPANTFRIAGLANPTIAVKSGARITIEVVNADSDAAHGLVITSVRSAPSQMPMLTATPAFSGSALWFLGNPTSAGMHAGTLSFTVTASGTYQYLCPLPGDAKDGMVGTFIVSANH